MPTSLDSQWASSRPTRSEWVSRLINRVLAVKPLAALAKGQARRMMVNRAEAMGVPWRQTVYALQTRSEEGDRSYQARPNHIDPLWEAELAQIQSPNLTYPDYYLTSFHAYEEGNMGWIPAMEVEMAALAVHARIWPEAGIEGDARLRQRYTAALTEILGQERCDAVSDVVDVGCGVGMSTLALKSAFPNAKTTGVDLSPYFLAIAQYRHRQRLASSDTKPLQWVHSPAESTPLPGQRYDLVSACLVFHELPQQAARGILTEARRLLRPGGHVAIMDMNPGSETFAKMPPFVFTLLKSTEPYLDEYLSLDLEHAIEDSGFQHPQVVFNSPRHRTLVAQVR